MDKKRLITIALIIVLALSFASCGGGNKPAAGNNQPPQGETEDSAPSETEDTAPVFVETLDTEMDEATRGNTSSSLSSTWGNAGEPVMVGDLILLGSKYVTPDGNENKYPIESDLYMYSINVKGDTVYFLNAEEENDGNRIIYKMSADCSVIEEVFTANNPIRALIMHGDWLYYSTYDSAKWEDTMSRIKTDGTGNEVIADSSLGENGGFFAMWGKFCVGMNAIYYTGYGKIWKAELDGSNPRRLGNVELQIATNPFIHGEWIYYESVNENSETLLYRIRTDGTGEMAVLDYEVYNCDFGRDEIYYIAKVQEGENAGHNAEVYAINVDGSGEPRLVYDENSVVVIIVMGDVLYLNGILTEYIVYTDGRVIMEQTNFLYDYFTIVNGW